MSLTSALQALPPETLAELKRMVARLDDQDNDCTRDPLFEVRQKKLQWHHGMDANDSELTVWVSDGDPETNAEERARLEAHYDEHGEGPEGWERVGGWWERGHVQSFFTREGAEAFVAKRGYHYENPYISTESAYRNPELLAVQALLVALTEEINAVDSTATPPVPSWTTQTAGVSDEELVEQLRADPVVLRRMEAAVERAKSVPTSANGGPYFIACFKRPHTGYLTWWRPDNAGYTNDLAQAGTYPTFIPNYHDNEETVPVPVAFVSQFGGRIRRMIDIGDSGNQCFHSARALREALSSFQQVGERQDLA